MKNQLSITPASRQELRITNYIKRGFTLVELMVAVAIVALISGGGLIYLNDFNQWQKLESLKGEVLSKLRLAVNYAKTRQVPVDYGGGRLSYVQVQMSNGVNLIAGVNGVGTTFFSQKVSEAGTIVSTNPATIYFWGGDGHLVSDLNGTPYGAGTTATVYVGISAGTVQGYYPLSISSLGTISAGSLVKGSGGP